MEDDDEEVVILPVRSDWFDVLTVSLNFLTGCAGSFHNSMHSLTTMAIAHGNWRYQQAQLHEQVAREIETLPTKE